MSKNLFIIIIVTTFVVVLIWVSAEILHSKSNVPISPDLQKAMEPVDPNFDNEILEEVKNLPKHSSPPESSPSATPSNKLIDNTNP